MATSMAGRAVRGLVVVAVVVLWAVPAAAAWWPWTRATPTPATLPQHAQERDPATFEPTMDAQIDVTTAASTAQLQAGWKELHELETSHNPCLLQAVVQLRVRCEVLDHAERVRLAVLWLNCQRAASRFAPIACSAAAAPADCVGAMDKDDFTQYSLYFLKVGDVCTALANDVFRAQVGASVQRLYRATHDAHTAANRSASELHALRDAMDALATAAAADRAAAAAEAAAASAATTSAWADLAAVLAADVDRHRAQWRAWQDVAALDHVHAQETGVALIAEMAGKVSQALADADAAIGRIQRHADVVTEGLAAAAAAQEALREQQERQRTELEATHDVVAALDTRVVTVARSVDGVHALVAPGGDLPRALAGLVSALEELDLRSDALAADLDSARSSQQQLAVLQAEQAAVLQAASGAAGTLEAQLHAIVRVVRFLGAALAHALALARRAVALLAGLVVALFVAGVAGGARWPVVLAWAWAAVIDVSLAVGHTGTPPPDASTLALARVLQWLPAVLWALPTVNAVATAVRHRLLSPPPAHPTTTATGATTPSADAVLVAALVEYTVALRLHGAAAAMPAALVAVLETPPPAYERGPTSSTTDAKVSDDDADWLVAHDA